MSDAPDSPPPAPDDPAVSDPEHNTAQDAPDPNEPIDADFEPAPVDPPRRTRSGGPGWVTLGLATLAATGLGGAIGIFAGGNGPAASAIDAAALTAQMETLQQAQSQTDLQLGKLSRDAGERELRLKDEISKAASSAALPDDLSALIADLEAASARLDTALQDAADPLAVEALSARLDTLEAIDTDGDAAPADLVRAIASIDERLQRMEARADELGERIDARDAVLTQLSSRITEAEFAGVGQGAGLPSDAAGELADLSAQVAALQADLDTVKTTQGADADQFASVIANLQAETEQTRSSLSRAEAGAEAALALSAIEAAARTGKPFAADHAKLRAALPDSAPVRTLGGLAATGAPTLETLTQQFADARKAALDTGASDTGAIGWLGTVFGDAVSIEPADAGAAGDALARAKTALDRGDLKAATGALTPLSGDAADALSDWTRDATRRITLDEALDALRLELIGAGQ